jgi:hypothetical protein
MLEKLLSPFTTATSAGVTIRYIITIITSMLAILGTLGLLTPEQVEDVLRKVQEISGQLPALLAAVSGLIAVFVPIYAAMTKSSSDKAAKVAKEVDEQIPASAPVTIKTPEGVPDIVVPADKKGS